MCAVGAFEHRLKKTKPPALAKGAAKRAAGLVIRGMGLTLGERKINPGILEVVMPDPVSELAAMGAALTPNDRSRLIDLLLVSLHEGPLTEVEGRVG